MSNNVSLIPKKPSRHTLLTSTENVVYMPIASKHAHGIVKIGGGLVVTADGVVSVDFENGWYADVQNDINTLKIDVTNAKNQISNIDNRVINLDARLIDVETGVKLIPIYQTKQDYGLGTVSKTVVGGINELKDQTILNKTDIFNISKDVTDVKTNYATIKYVDNLYSTISMGGAKTFVFDTRQDFLNWLDGTYERKDGIKPNNLNKGDMILIKEMGVPDYWMSEKSTPVTILDFSEYEAKIEIPDIKIDNISISKNDNDELQTIALKGGFIKLNDVVTRDDFKGWIELSQEQYDRLIKYGSIEVDNEIIIFDDNDVYVTPDTSYSMLQGHTAPTETTVGYIGQFYLDLISKTLYQCVEVDDTTPSYTWKQVGGSSGVSQEDFDKLVNNEVQIKTSNNGFMAGGAESVSEYGVAIGKNARVYGQSGTAVGYYSKAGTKCSAFGHSAFADTYYSVAMGYTAEAKASHAIQLGQGTNKTEKTLQVHNDNIYNSKTHTLTVQNIELNGEDLATKLENAGGGTVTTYTDAALFGAALLEAINNGKLVKIAVEFNNDVLGKYRILTTTKTEIVDDGDDIAKTYAHTDIKVKYTASTPVFYANEKWVLDYYMNDTQSYYFHSGFCDVRVQNPGTTPTITLSKHERYLTANLREMYSEAGLTLPSNDVTLKLITY